MKTEEIRQINNDFDFDRVQEEILRECVLDTFFEYLKRYGCSVTSVDDKPRQLKGIDLIAQYKHRKDTSYIDIKAQANNYINKPTNTFCLELSYYKDGVLKTGWYLRDDLDTTDYLLMWIMDSAFEVIKYIDYNGVRKSRKMVMKPEDVYEYQLISAKTKTVHEWMAAHGLTDERVRKINDFMRTQKGISLMKRGMKPGEDKLRVYYDLKTQKATVEKPTSWGILTFVSTLQGEKNEQPINLVVPKRFWHEMSNGDFTIKTRNGLEVTDNRKAEKEMKKSA